MQLNSSSAFAYALVWKPAFIKVLSFIFNVMTTQDFVLNDYQGRLVSWHLGLWERQDYLYPLPAVWLTKGLEKPRISLEEDVPIIKRQNNGQVYKLKPGGVGGGEYHGTKCFTINSSLHQRKRNKIVTLWHCEQSCFRIFQLL